MHEMSIAQSVLDIVKDEMARHGVQKLQAINLVVGKLAAVVPEHLDFCFGFLIDNTELEGTILRIREVPLTYRCRSCQKEFTSEEMTFSCQFCKEENPDMIGGREMTIENIEVAD